MTIAYTYTVLSVDSGNKSMLVRFESAGRQTVDVMLPLPSVGQSLAEAIEPNAPTYFWEQRERDVESVTPGSTGSGATAPTVLVTPGVPFSQFYGLFTNSEKNALIGATQTDVPTKRRYDELLMLNLVSTALPEVEMLLTQLVSLSALTNERKTTILAALPAPETP